MNTLITIIKDSYREAVDGFVIYVMLVLATIILILAASVSFEPADPKVVLERTLNSFPVYIPDRGQSEAIGAVRGLTFQAEQVSQDGSDVQFQLNVINPEKDPDAFHRSIVGWQKLPKNIQEFKMPRGVNEPGQADVAKQIEIALTPNATQPELDGVTREDEIEFLDAQFNTHYGISKAEISLVSQESAKNPSYNVILRNASHAPGWMTHLKLFFGAYRAPEPVPTGVVVFVIEEYIFNGIGALVALLIGVIITAFFVPNMIRKGSLDLIIAKPVNRIWLLISKYIGGCIFIFLISLYAIGGAWLILCLRTGYWSPNFLLVIPALTFTFALVYSFSVLVSVFTRSAIASIMLSIGFMFGLWLVGTVKSDFENRKVDPNRTPVPEWAHTLVDTMNNVLPRYKDLDKITQKMIIDGNFTPIYSRLFDMAMEFPNLTSTILLSLLYICIFMGIASWRFATRDG